MNTKIFLIVGVIVVVVAGAVFFSRGGGEQSNNITVTSPGFIGENSIDVPTEQIPSNVVALTVVRLERPGFVVIHDGDGTLLPEGAVEVPGAILGASGLLPAGETRDPESVVLSDVTKDGETIYAMLHLDDGDGVFDAAKDKPAEDMRLGGPIMANIDVWVGADTLEPGAINP